MFIHPDLIHKDVNISMSYFIDSKIIPFQYIEGIFSKNLPPDLKENAAPSSVIPEMKLNEIWACISSLNFKCHQKKIVNTWALLPSVSPPILYRGQSPILPVVMHTSDDLNEVEKLTNVVPILNELNIPFLKPTTHTDSMRQYCPAISENRKVLDVIYELYKSDEDTVYSLITGLTDEQIKLLFEYLNVTTIYDSCLEKIKCLPLFKTVNNKLTSLTSKSVYLWPSDDFCEQGYEKWAPFDKIVFLKVCASWKALCRNDFKLIGKELTPTEVYSKLIFKVFKMLTYEERRLHLIYIRDKIFPDIEIDWNSSRRKGKVELFVNNLKSLEVLNSPSSDAVLLPISSFADHTVSIFNLFPEKFMFLDKEYKHEEWLKFLQFFGLQTKLTTNEYVELCRLVSNNSNRESVSKQLVKYLFSSNSSEIVKDKTAMAEISEIDFVHVDTAVIDTLSWIAKPKVVGLTKFCEAVISEHASLMWTVKPVISIPDTGSIFMNKKELVKQLKITTKPSFEDVLANILNISHSEWSEFKLFEKYPTKEGDQQSTKLLIEVMIDNLKYLYETKPDSMKELAEVPCIPINAEAIDSDDSKLVLVNSMQVVMHLTTSNSLFPYINPLPQYLFKSSPELSAIGVSSGIELKHVKYMLKSLHEQYPRLHSPNVKNLVTNAISTLHELLGSYDGDGRELIPLYLPSINDTLVLSTDLVYLDMGRYRKHVVDTLDFSQSKYSQFYIPIASMVGGPSKKLAEKDVYLSLPITVRPHCLSHICQEEIKTPISYAGTSSKLEEHLGNVKLVSQHEICREGLTKIIESSNGTIVFSNTLIDVIQSFELKTVSNLKSIITIDGKLIGTVKVNYLLQKNDGESYILYTDTGISKIERIVMEELAQSLCIEVTHIVQEDFVLSDHMTDIVKEFISIQSLPDFQSMLEKYNINDVEFDETLTMKDDSLPVIGQPMSAYWISCLDSNANYIYKPQEWVGYEISEDNFIWAIVLHPSIEDNSDMVSINNNNPLLKKYAIQISNEEDSENEGVIIVSILSLYKLVPREFKEELVPFNEEFGTQSQSSQIRDSLNLKRLKKTICEQLKLIWELPETERKTALRRLYLQYHPDKADPCNVYLYEEAFKFLMQQVERLENNLPLIDPDEEEKVEEHTSFYDSNWTGLFNQWNESARRRKSHRNRGRRRKSRFEETWKEQEMSEDTGRQEEQEREERQSERRKEEARPEERANRSTHFSFQPKTNKEEAKRWMKQATSDLSAMMTLTSNLKQEISPQIVFMAHQVMEKSLKAGMYALLGLNPIYLTKHHLTAHAIALSSVEPSLSSLKDVVDGMEPHYLNTCYPNRYPLPYSPVDKYTVDHATKYSQHAQLVYNLILPHTL